MGSLGFITVVGLIVPLEHCPSSAPKAPRCTSSPQPKAASLSQCLPDLGTSQEGQQAAQLQLLKSGSELAWQSLAGRPILSRMKGVGEKVRFVILIIG